MIKLSNTRAEIERLAAIVDTEELHQSFDAYLRPTDEAMDGLAALIKGIVELKANPETRIIAEDAEAHLIYEAIGSDALMDKIEDIGRGSMSTIGDKCAIDLVEKIEKRKGSSLSR